jgi:biopolymer transport protein ExbD
MAITFNNSRNEDDALMSEINTTPLVDVMLVLLIIFLITIPAVTTSIQVKLPTAKNIKSEAELETVVISIDKSAVSYWRNDKITNPQDLQNRLNLIKQMPIKPIVHIRGDASVSFESIGQLVYSLKEVGVTSIGFITQPPDKN